MAFQPAFGHLFTDFPVKMVFVAAILLFEVGSIICATATSSLALIIGRLVAGAGGGGLYVGTLTFMALAVPIRKRAFYISLVTSMFGVASVAGPLLGGIFTDSKLLTWRFCFWINLPIGFVALVLVSLTFKAPKTNATSGGTLGEKLQSLDPIGLLVLLAAFVCLLLPLQWAGTRYPWSDSHVIGCFVGFVARITVFVALQICLRDRASIPLWLARQRTVAASSLFLLFISLIVGLLIYYLPLYFQLVKGSSARASGIQNLPFLVTMLFSPVATGALVSTFGFYVPFMWLGAILATLGSGLLSTLRVDSTDGIVSAFQFITGLGLGLCTQIPFNAVQYILPQNQMAMGSAIVSFCNSLGPILGTNVGQVIFSNVFLKRLEGVPDIGAKEIILAGPTTDLASIGNSATVMEAFNYSLTRTFVLAIASGTLAFASSLAMEWGNVKRERKGSQDSVQTEIEPGTQSARSGISEDVPMSAKLAP
ncbi:MAG: hypothetical protein LQ349_001075 [Xanthoria aureola]|nr:MAG: hypothetical protein LQ349_001075 [Xanthoria aureola]